MSAYIFLCDLSTEKECIDRRLFGSNPGDAHRYHYSKIAVGDTLFLYNFEMGFLRGPFKALTTCKSNIDPAAWKKTRRSFPWQVRVDVAEESKRWLDNNDVGRSVAVTTGPKLPGQ